MLPTLRYSKKSHASYVQFYCRGLPPRFVRAARNEPGSCLRLASNLYFISYLSLPSFSNNRQNSITNIRTHPALTFSEPSFLRVSSKAITAAFSLFSANHQRPCASLLSGLSHLLSCSWSRTRKRYLLCPQIRAKCYPLQRLFFRLS